MRQRAMLFSAVAVVVCGAVAVPASAATLCVGRHGGCYRGVQEAVDAAHDGDTIRVRTGAYAGGVRIDASLTLRGAGAAVTRIRGGGPVLTVGAPFAPDPPTVRISGVTISGGLTTSTLIEGELQRERAWAAVF